MVRNTVWEIYKNVPLFVVLELGELEYPIFLFQRGTRRGIWNLKNKLSTRAHEARVLFEPNLSPCYPHLNHLLPTNQTISYPHFNFLNLPLNLAISLSISAINLAIYLSISLSSSTQILSFSLSISRSTSFYVSLLLSVSLSLCSSRSRSPFHKVCLAQLACSACGYFCL